jgi:prepilin-type N-terminal cleavage/methylation domain-containing protein
MSDRLRTLRRSEDGFSLIELMAAMAIGGVVLTALMGIFINGTRATTEIQNRVDSTGRAQFALDRVVRLLDSQECVALSATSDVMTAPVFANSTDNQVSFFGDVHGASDFDPNAGTIDPDKTPNRFVVTYTPKSGSAGGTLSVERYAYSPAAKTFSVKVGPTNVIASDIVPVKDSAGNDQPIFRYYPYVTAASGSLTVGDVNTQPAGTPLSTAVAPTIVKVAVQFAAVSSTSHQDNKQHAFVSGSGALATFDADPTSPKACP